MYVYELARELGAEPREIIERAAVEGLGHVAPNTALTAEQVRVIREAHARAANPSRSLFSGGAPAAPPPPPTAAPPAATAVPPEPVDSYDSPLLRPIHDPDEPLAPGALGGPLSFDPGATESSYAPSPAPRPSGPSMLDEPPVWEPLPAVTALGGPPAGDSGPGAGSARSASTKLTDAEYESQYRPDDWTPPKPETSTVTRTVVIGIVGLLVIVLASMFVGRQLGIIGPGAERHCVITITPVAGGEGEVEELLCVDGYGKEVRREVREPDADARALEFGATAEGAPTRVVRLEDFCRGAADFLEFREGLLERVSDGPSMIEVGRWYEENDGFGIAGVGNMVDSFGNAGPNPAVVALNGYLSQVHQASRSAELPQAQMALGAAEGEHGEQILSVRNFRNSNC